MATWCITDSDMCRMTSRLRARGTLYSIVAAAGLCMSVAAAQHGDFVPDHVASLRAHAAAPEGVQSSNAAVSFETERLPPWYSDSETNAGYMIPNALTLPHTYVQDIPRSTSVLLSAQAPVYPARRLATLNHGTNRSQAAFDGSADSPPSLALSQHVQQMLPFSASSFRHASQAFSPSDAAAPKPAAFRSDLSAASAGSGVLAPLSNLVLLPAAAAHSFANRFASRSVLRPIADVNMPTATPYSPASSSFLSRPSYEVVPPSPLTFRNGSIPYAASSTLPVGTSASTFSSTTARTPESPPRSAPYSATAAPAALRSLSADSRKLLHEQRNKKGVAGAVEGLGDKCARGKISRQRNVLGAREVQETRGVRAAHTVRKVNRTKKACNAPESWKTTEQEELGSQHKQRRPHLNERKHFVRCEGSDQPNGVLLQNQIIPRESQVDRVKGHEFRSGRRSDGDSFSMRLRQLAPEPDTSGDILSNAPLPAALNYAFFRGFGKPRLPSFFSNPRSPATAVAVAAPGYELIQYASNVDLPVWGAIPNYPMNFSSA